MDILRHMPLTDTILRASSHTQLRATLNAYLLTLVNPTVTRFEVQANDIASRPGIEYSALVTVDAGGPALATPFTVDVLEDTTLPGLQQQLDSYRAATVGQFTSGARYLQTADESITVSRWSATIMKNAAPGAAQNFAADGGLSGGVPAPHAASHAAAGSDPLTLTQSQITNLTADLAAKAPLASPALTGVPTAPTAALHTNTTQVASTAFAKAEADAAQAAAQAASDPVGAAAAVGASSLQKASNLADVTSAATARANLGLGGSATLNVGVVAGTVAAGNDARFTDARTPTAHAASHAAAGSDPLTLTQSQITNLTADLAAKVAKAGDTMTGELILAGVENSPGGLTKLSSAFGKNALAAVDPNLTTNQKNAVFGPYAMDTATNPNFTVAIGYDVLGAIVAGTCSGVVAIGASAADVATSASNSVVIGSQAMHTATNIASTCAVGYRACRLSVCINNAAFGNTALEQQIDGNAGGSNAAFGNNSLKKANGRNNTVLGTYGMQNLVTGDGNVAIGFSAGSYAVSESGKLHIHNDTVLSWADELIYGDFATGEVWIKGAKVLTATALTSFATLTDLNNLDVDLQSQISAITDPPIVTPTQAAGVVTVSMLAGAMQTVTLTANGSLAVSNVAVGRTVTLRVIRAGNDLAPPAWGGQSAALPTGAGPSTFTVVLRAFGPALSDVLAEVTTY